MNIKYPYTDFQEFNLDFVLEKMKELENKIEEQRRLIENLLDRVERLEGENNV